MNQSVLAKEIIFIIDGPIDKEQYNILEYYKLNLKLSPDWKFVPG